MVTFSDGFESGDFTAWTGTANTAGDTCAVEHVHPHHLLHNALFTTDGSATGETAYCYETIASDTTYYARAYFKIETAFPAASKAFRLIQLGAGTTQISFIDIYNNAGTMQWRLCWHNAAVSTWTAYTPAVAIALDTWYCLELKVVIDAAAGEYRLYIDGTERITQTAKDSNEHGNITRASFGEVNSDGQTAHAIVTDCCVIDTSYIGVEASVAVKKGSSLANTMAMALNSKMLFGMCNRFPKLTSRRL